MRRLVLLLSIGGLLSTPVFAQDAVTLTPDQIAQIFCMARTGNDMGPIEGLMTPELAAAIADAETENAASEAANPGEKPPLGDGIPWQAYPDYAPECAVGQVSYEMDESRVWIDYRFPESPDANFTDVLHLKLVAGKTGWTVWRLDNVAFATDGDLRTSLVSAFMN